MLKFLIYIIILFVLFLFQSHNTVTAQNQSDCENRYLTLINPVRGKNLWFDQSLQPISSQYFLIKEHNFAASWLLQYDVLLDDELIKEIKSFNDKQELGVFLEISQKLGDDSRIAYPINTPWFSPKAVFLSGYSQSERRKLIDKLFERFKSVFGFYPKSVGAWWIDSYSLNYMEEQYGIRIALIVADQLTTDNYGIWGQWWGIPYYPSKANILTPASSLSNKQNVVILQWAQRDPLLAYGEGIAFSNYSLQANDYKSMGQDISYFDQLVNAYLDCQNPIGQITVGLETGIESIGFIDEYKVQLEHLDERNNLHSVTMSQFADKFSTIYPDFPKEGRVTYQDSSWSLSTFGRSNDKLKDVIVYNSNVAFWDYFLAEKDEFLDRRLSRETKQENIRYFPYFLIASLGLFYVAFRKNLLKIWVISNLFALAAFGLILRSYYQFGWEVYFGPKLPFLQLVQISLIFISFYLFFTLNKLKNKLNFLRVNLWLFVLVFGFDYLLKIFRFSIIDDKYLLGIAFDDLRFVGIAISKNLAFHYVNQDLPAYISSALLKFDFYKIFNNQFLALVIYPLAHIALAIILGLILTKLSSRMQKIIIFLLIILFVFHISSTLNSDPHQITPILLEY